MYFSLFIGSLVFNLLLVIGFILYLRRSRKIEKPDLSQDANQLLSELLSGGAVVVTQIIDPKSMFLYSPKDQ